MASEIIYGGGYDSADLMIVGDYARKFDESSRRCLSGYYETQLNKLLAAHQYNLHQSYRTCVVKHYFKGLGVGTWKSDKKLLEYFYDTAEGLSYPEYVKMLVEEINAIKPAVIMGLGEYTLRTLTGKEGIGKWRGSVLPLLPEILSQLTYPGAANTKVLCTHHVSVLHTQEELVYIMRIDAKKVVDLLFQSSKPIDYHEIHIARNCGDLIRFTDQYPIEEFPDMTYDIETHLGFITCAGISFDGYRGICMPLTGNASIAHIEKARMSYMLASLLETRQLINQNIGYDKRISQRFGYHLKNVKWDTMLAAHTLAAEFPKNLGFLTSIYTDMSFYKDEGRDYDPSRQSPDVLYGYNVKDAISTFQIYKRQLEDIKEMEMLEFFQDFVMPLFTVYYDMESVGLLIDQSKRSELIIKYESLRDLKYLELKSITENDINTSSPTQIGKYMEGHNFPVLRHRVESGFMVVNTDAESLKKMRSADAIEYKRCSLPHKYAKRFIDLVLLIRRIDKILEYIDVGIHPWGRVHTSPKLSGTSSGRTSGSKTADGIYAWTEDKKKFGLKLKALGQSLQTVTKHGFIVEDEHDEENDDGGSELSAIDGGIIGKDLRDMYIPDEGYALVEVDLSQAEARVVDLLAEDYEGLEEYGILDKHCKVASFIYTEHTYEELLYLSKKLKTDEGVAMRQLGKKSKHATNYEMEPFRFSFLAGLEISEAKKVLAAVHRAYPKVRGVFHKQVEEQVRKTRTLRNPLGRIRVFYKKLDSHGIKVAYSWIPQSTVSDHMKRAMLNLSRVIDRTRAFYVAENHDSLTSLVHLSYLREYCELVKPEMERGIDFRSCSLPRDYELKIPCEFAISTKNWGNMKEIKNLEEVLLIQ